jgi:hypothetical protein
VQGTPAASQSCLASNQTPRRSCCRSLRRLLPKCFALLILACLAWSHGRHAMSNSIAGLHTRPSSCTQVQAAINAVEDHDVLNQEVDYVAEGERLLQQRYAAQPQPPPPAAAATAPQLQQPPPPVPPQPAAAAAPPWPATHAPAPQVSSESAATVHARHIQHSPVAVLILW